MNTGNAPTAVAAIAVAAKRKRIYNLFRLAGATTASGAKSLQEIHVAESRMLHRLIRRGEIVATGQNRYYLDETAVQSGRRKRITIMVLGIVVIALIWGGLQFLNRQ